MAAQAIGISVSVEHSEKVRHQFVFDVLNGKILLMVAHHGDQHFFRQSKELFVKAAENRGGPLGQVDYGLQQLGVLTPARPRNHAGGCVQGIADAILSLARIDNDFHSGEHTQILVYL